MNYFKIANRNVTRQKRRSNMLAISIAFGTMIIILLQSLTSGLVTNTQKSITTAMGGHIYISGDELLESGKIVSRISDTKILQDALLSVDSSLIKDYQKRSVVTGSLIFHSSKSGRASVVGVDWNHEKSLHYELNIIEGNLDKIYDPSSIVLSKEAYEDLGAGIGDKIIFNFQTVTGQENVEEYNIIAVAESNMSFGISSSYVSIVGLNNALGLGADEFQTLNIELYNGNKIDLVQNQLEKSIEEEGGTLPTPISKEDTAMNTFGFNIFQTNMEQEWTGTRFTVTNLNDFLDIILQVINIINAISFVIFLIMILITMLGLVNTFRMIMNERVLEIGTMRAMGMQKKDVKKLLHLEGVLLATRGVVYGIIVELLLSRIISLFSFKGSDNPALQLLLKDGHISFPIQILYTLFVAALVMAISLFAISQPVRKALKKSVADELR